MILLDLEEKMAVAVGTNWYEKGFDNFAVLTGGILAVARADADVIEGDLPSSLLAPPAYKAVRPSSRRTGRGEAGGAGGGAAGCLCLDLTAWLGPETDVGNDAVATGGGGEGAEVRRSMTAGVLLSWLPPSALA